ncbi:MAG TPA: hypothetical protein VF173_21350 [Thermoanaerobaculia bacterium]|nr:hypothetical protein [Thermoanaerobaculia bacterium]
MRKKLALLALALAAFTAAATARPAAALTCPAGSHPIVCTNPDRSFCCPNNAFCVCFPG